MLRFYPLAIPALLLLAAPAGAQTPDGETDIFQFFAEEAKVVSASRIPDTIKRSPATVYVVTAQDIKDSGAQNIWDALRGVPGVDVIQVKAGQGEVSIRGMAKPGNTRTMVLLDGRKVLNSFSDYITWSELPVTLQEIDRIEVVQGPASAIYGANAVNGAINIITKSPERFRGGLFTQTLSQRGTNLTSFDYGDNRNKWAYRFGGGRERVNSFGRKGELSSRDGKANFFAAYRPGPEREIRFPGGLAGMKTKQGAPEATGSFVNQGRNGFLDAGYTGGGMQFRANWSHYDGTLVQYPAVGDIPVRTNSFFGEAQGSLALPFENELIVGANFRSDYTSAGITEKRIKRNTEALIVEDRYTPAPELALHASARLDRNNYVDDTFSSRGSVVFTPSEDHTLRFSAGTAFKTPTLVENFIDTKITVPNPGGSLANPPFEHLLINTYGNTDLKPERIRTAELSYTLSAGDADISVTGFHNVISNLVYPTKMELVGTPTPPDATMQTTFHNTGSMRISGGEFALNARLLEALAFHANYSYQKLTDSPGPQIVSRQSPLNKVNAGLRYKRSAWTLNADMHWVDATAWLSTARQPYTPQDLYPVRSYFIINAHAGYAFAGALEGLEAGLSAFNLLNRAHYETLPQLSSALPGQGGEIVRASVTGALSYRF